MNKGQGGNPLSFFSLEIDRSRCMLSKIDLKKTIFLVHFRVIDLSKEYRVYHLQMTKLVWPLTQLSASLF